MSLATACQAKGNDDQQQATANPLKVASKKKRYGVAITDRRKPRQHIVLGLIHHQGRYRAQRPIDKHAGGFWELPGGKREQGEDDRTALARGCMRIGRRTPGSTALRQLEPRLR